MNIFQELVHPTFFVDGVQSIQTHGCIINVPCDPFALGVELCNQGLAQRVKGQWRVTEKGKDFLKRRN